MPLTNSSSGIDPRSFRENIVETKILYRANPETWDPTGPNEVLPKWPIKERGLSIGVGLAIALAVTSQPAWDRSQNLALACLAFLLLLTIAQLFAWTRVNRREGVVAAFKVPGADLVIQDPQDGPSVPFTATLKASIEIEVEAESQAEAMAAARYWLKLDSAEPDFETKLRYAAGVLSVQSLRLGTVEDPSGPNMLSLRIRVENALSPFIFGLSLTAWVLGAAAVIRLL